MIEAHLITADGLKKPVKQIGDTLVIENDRMQMSESLVAIHQRHAWELGDDSFVVMKIDSRTTVHFETADGQVSETHGPFDQLWVVDGMVLTGLDEELPLARFDYNTKLWVCPADESQCARVVFTKAEG